MAFIERSGGVSESGFATLNVAAHVGDDPSAVDENRYRVLNALGMEGLRDRLVTAQQVHGYRVVVVEESDKGRGAYADGGDPPIPGSDALVTTTLCTPLLMSYADCVPLVLVSLGLEAGCRKGVSVVHAGWRGALARIPERAAEALVSETDTDADKLIAYIGPHIRSCCYGVDEELLSQFCNTFGTIAAVDGRLNLSAAVRESLLSAGLKNESIVDAGVCTFDTTDRFFSYRAEKITGRHGAIAAVMQGCMNDTSVK